MMMLQIVLLIFSWTLVLSQSQATGIQQEILKKILIEPGVYVPQTRNKLCYEGLLTFSENDNETLSILVGEKVLIPHIGITRSQSGFSYQNCYHKTSSTPADKNFVYEKTIKCNHSAEEKFKTTNTFVFSAKKITYQINNYFNGKSNTTNCELIKIE